jgi:hypothetical protein
MQEKDVLRRFLFDGLAVRGEWLNITASLYKKAIYVLLNGFYHQSDCIAEQFFQFI